MKKYLSAAALLLALLPFVLHRTAPCVVAPQAVSVAVPAPAISHSPEFERWALEYAAADATARAAMLEVGKQLAQAHRARMKTLIATDPRHALEEAMPVRLRQSLPAEIMVLIEQRVNARGTYGVLGVLGGDAAFAGHPKQTTGHPASRALRGYAAGRNRGR